MRDKILTTGLACSIALGACSPADTGNETTSGVIAENQPVHWRMTSTFPSSLTMLGTLGKRLENQLALISGGNIDLKFHEPGALAPPLESFEAVSYGAIEAAWSTSGYWAGKEPALQIFTSVPFGPDGPEYLAWYRFGGGQEIYEDIYRKHNIHGMICGLIAPEASGWFNRTFEKTEDLKGMKIRFFGLGGKVLEKLGASAQLLAGGDIMPALQLGTIDGAEYSMPAIDNDMGFWQVAKYYYFPGWHQQSSFFELIINLDAWNSLSETQQAQFESVCGDNISYGLAEGEAIQVAALEELEAHGVSIETWPDEVLVDLEVAWNEVAVELAAEDENFARAWDSLSAFREDYKTWRELGYLKRK